MTPLELIARRKRMGLSQEELGRCLGLVSPMPDGSPRPPVKQATIAGWEGARGIPDWADEQLPELLYRIDEQADVMCDRIGEIIEHSSGVRNSPTVTIRGYSTDAGFWRDWPDMTGWPHIMWNMAATVAMDEMHEEYGIITTLIDGDDRTFGAAEDGM
ncbi:hypothetical protein COO72_11970 [Bifidobacterium callitrichos]|nr:hypothetical protein COO72_11970 [Bifidobacterium callitrichos]